MSDRQKSTCTTSASTRPPAESDWERHATFRHTLLAHLPPDVAEAVEHLGSGMYHFLLALEADCYRGSWTVHRLRATVADLRFHAGYLAELARERQASALSPTDAHLSERAEAWSTQAEALATHIETALP
jgi:hypothetical protein